MDFDAIVNVLKAKWSECEAPVVESGDRFVIAPADKAFEILKYLKEDAALYFDNLINLAGVDTGQELWVVYHLHSLRHLHCLEIKLILGREVPECDSIVKLWGAANFFEREIYDLYGITFRGHPDLRRLLNPPDWEGWPMRKDYQFPSEYHGVKTARDDQYFAEHVEASNKAREEKTRLNADEPQPNKKKEV